MKTSQQQIEYVEIDISKRKTKGRPQNKRFHVSELIPLRPNEKTISEKKIKDIKSILHLISQDLHYLYKRFTPDNNVQDDIDGFDAVLDLPIENKD